MTATAAGVRLTEAAFQAQVIEYAQLRGWKVAHFRPARTADGGWRTPVAADGAGFPDLVLVRGNNLIAAELKSATGRLSDAQDAWIGALISTPADVYVWRPAQWPMIEQVLR